MAAVKKGGGGADSVRELARAVGKSHVAVGKWLVDDRWPFARKPPWNAATVQKVIAWAAATLAPNPAVSSPATPTDSDVQGRSIERQVKLKRLLAQAKLTEAQLRILEGEWLPKDEVDKGRVERVQAVKTALLTLPDSGAVEAMMSGTLQEAKDVLRGRLIEICQRFAAVG